MTEYSIFYSWQSDNKPNGANRTFIQDALSKAVKEIKKEENLSINPVVDRDTAGVPGSPNIAEEILKKIERTQIFVCDVSIINDQFCNEDARPTPNPNVLFELGYALKTLGDTDRIILVMNTIFGGPEKLPFDLKMQRTITYRLSEDSDQEDRANEKKTLTSKLKRAIETIITEHGIRSLEDYIEADRRLFTKIKNTLNQNDTIKLLRETDYGGAFPRDIHIGIMEFDSKIGISNPEFEFFDPDLENSRTTLSQKIHGFLGNIGQYTFPQSFNPAWNRISTITDRDTIVRIGIVASSEGEYQNRLDQLEIESRQIQEQLNNLAQDVCVAYDDFVRLCRQKLAV